MRAAILAVALLLSSSSVALADEPTDEAATEPEAAAEAEAPSVNEGVRRVEPDFDPRGTLRFADRRQVLFRVGFGGRYDSATLGDPKAQASYGVTFRWERPVHEYVTTGLAFSIYGTKSTVEFSRQPGFEAALHLKGRYPFQMGRKARKFEAEVYLLAEGGFLIWLNSSLGNANLIGPGWAIGAAPGFLFFINDRVGLLGELGWVHTEAFFTIGNQSILLHQGVARVGAVFPF